MEKRKLILISMLITFGFGLGIVYSKTNKKSKLDHHYFERLKMIKNGMLYGSPADNEKELGRYQDHTELCMHLDGYNGLEIMDMRCKAFIEAAKEGRATSAKH